MGAVVEERTETPASGEADQPPARRRFRADIQALRAIAVLGVVLNHLWPEGLTGGYVGVDVFFVISGFLISSHLTREVETTGRVRLGRFYARRVRRLLPAAFLVLAASLVAAYFLLPYPRWAANAQEAVAGALYWENWLLAAHSIDYSAANAAASLVQHYWSLSVEEQFYLVWPLLLLAAWKVRARRAAFGAVAVAGAASLVFSVHLTATSPNEAYFVTPVRVWEFALGALVALAAHRLRLPRAVAEVAALVGFGMIVAAAVFYGHSTPFPGYLALVPTLGTALVIVAGTREGALSHEVVTARRPVRFLGDISYSLYLWHWPLILLTPYVLGGSPGTWHLLAVLAIAIVLAWLSKVLVEDRGMAWGRLTRSSGLTFSWMAVGMVAVVLSASFLMSGYEKEVAHAEWEVAQAAARQELCDGGGALDPVNECEDPLGPATITEMGPANEYFRLAPECEQLDEYMVWDKKTVTYCDFSDGAEDPDTVWLVGDSHAQQWQGPLFDLARERGWVLKLAYLGGCPFADIAFVGYRTVVGEEGTRACTDWTQRMADVITDDRPAAVVVSFFAREEYADDGSGRSQEDQYRDGLHAYWDDWTGAGARVVVVADPPLNRAVRPADCVAINPDDPRACAADRDEAHPRDPLTEVARSSDDVTLVDLTKYFCDADHCYAVVGHIAVYYDGDHLNLAFSRSLAPMLGGALPGAPGE